MFKKILLGLAAVVALLLVVVALQPANFTISRSATVNAPPAAVFGHVNDFHKWAAWSPFAKLDPNAKITYSGAPAGVGAGYAWTSESDQVGAGKMLITQSKAGELVAIKLDFTRPFAATNDATFTFKPVGNQTQVTWSMSGHRNFLFKAAGLFMNMDKMVGGDFEKGLASIKALVEAKGGK